MEHKELGNEINKIVSEELDYARAMFPDMASAHEGYATLLEEFEELQEEVQSFQYDLAYLWKAVKKDNISNQVLEIKQLSQTIKKVIKEAVQVAAMVQRFEEDVLDNENM